MKKTITTISISNDILENIKKNPLVTSLSDYVEKKYRDEFMSVDYLSHRLEDTIKETEYIRQQIKELKTKEQNILSLFTVKEILWLRSSGLSRRDKGHGLKYIFKFFRNEFGRRDLSLKQFELALDKLEEKAAEELL